MKISYYIQSHAKSVLWIGLLLCIASTTALYFSIHRDSFPQLELDIIFISAYHGESDANEALKNITIPLEDQINSFGGIKEILSLSSKGYVELQVILDGGGGTDDLLTEIKNAVYLPYVEIEAIRAGMSQDPIIDCIFTSNYHNENDLQLSVSDLKRALEDLDIVDQVRSFGLESDPKKKGLINFRFNGKPAIELIVHKKARVDIIQAKNQIEKHIQSLSNFYNLSYKTFTKKVDHVAIRLNMIFGAGVVSLISFMALGCYLYGRIALGYGIAIIFAFSASLLLLKYIGVNIDMLTSLFIVLQFGLSFAIVAILSDRVGMLGIRGLSACYFPVLCVVASILVSIISLSTTTGNMAKIFMFVQKTIIILTIVPSIIYFIFTPALSIFKHKSRLRFAEHYHRLVDKLLKHHRISIVMVLAVAGVCIFLNYNAFTRGSFSFFPKSKSSRIAVDLTGRINADIASAVEKIESMISFRTDIKDYKSYIGLKSTSSNNFDIDFSDNFAQVKIDLDPDADVSGVIADLRSVDLEAGISTEIHHGSRSIKSEIQVRISGDNPNKLLDIAADFQSALSEMEGVGNIRTDNDPDKILRKNSKQMIIINGDHDPKLISRRQVYQELEFKKEDYPGILIEFDEDKDTKQGNVKNFSRGLLYSIGILILLHIVITVYLRSILHFLIPFGLFYLFAGGALITNDFSIITFFSVIGLSVVFSSEILFFLQLIKNTDQPQLSVHTIILKCAFEKFNSTLLIFFSLFPVAVLLVFGDFALQAVGYSFCGALIFQLFFSSVLLPAVAKFELQLKRRIGINNAPKPNPDEGEKKTTSNQI